MFKAEVIFFNRDVSQFDVNFSLEISNIFLYHVNSLKISGSKKNSDVPNVIVLMLQVIHIGNVVNCGPLIQPIWKTLCNKTCIN